MLRGSCLQLLASLMRAAHQAVEGSAMAGFPAALPLALAPETLPETLLTVPQRELVACNVVKLIHPGCGRNAWQAAKRVGHRCPIAAAQMHFLLRLRSLLGCGGADTSPVKLAREAAPQSDCGREKVASLLTIACMLSTLDIADEERCFCTADGPASAATPRALLSMLLRRLVLEDCPTQAHVIDAAAAQDLMHLTFCYSVDSDSDLDSNLASAAFASDALLAASRPQWHSAATQLLDSRKLPTGIGGSRSLMAALGWPAKLAAVAACLMTLGDHLQQVQLQLEGSSPSPVQPPPPVSR